MSDFLKVVGSNGYVGIGGIDLNDITLQLTVKGNVKIDDSSLFIGTASVASSTVGSLSFSNKISGSAFNGSTNITIGHLTQSVSNGTHTSNTLVGSILYDDYAHLTKTNSIDIYTLFSGSAPIVFSNGTSSLLTSSNLKLSGSSLDTIQDIQTTSTPTFNQIVLSSTGSTTGAVRGDRTLQISTNNGITIDTSSVVNLTVDRSWLLSLTGQAKAFHDLSTNGIVTRTEADTIVARTINGTTNRISVSNSNGISGNPTIDISTNYAGQDTITTLGTIGNGTWNANIIGILYGGTNNTSYTNNKLLFYSASKIQSNDSIDYSNNTLTVTGSLHITNYLGSPIFASNFDGSGWRVDSLSKATFQDLTVRGTMNIYLLLINQIRATNGSLFVTSVGKVISYTSNSGSYTLLFDSLIKHGFLLNDLIRSQRYSNDNNLTYKIDLYVVLVLSTSSVKCNIVSGENYIEDYLIGSLFVRIGNTVNLDRQGTIYMTADNKPFIDIIDNVSSHEQFNSTNNVKVRLGDLSGISDPQVGLYNTNKYGLYSDNVHLKGVIYSNEGQIANWHIDLNGLSNNSNILLNSLLGYIKVSDGILLNSDGSFLFKTNLTNYISNDGSTLLIKTDNLLILTLKFILSSNELYLKFGSVVAYNSGSGIFIGKDLYSSASNLTDTLISSGSNELSFNSTTASAYSYSDYKLFIGLSTGNFLRYDGYNVLLTGKIIAKEGQIANWTITLNSLQTGTYNALNTIYFGTSGLSLSNKFIVDSLGNLTASNATISGSISSSVGKIGGWSLSSTSIYSGSSNFNTASSMYFGQSGLSIRDQFSVTSLGYLYANNAYISGSINSINGKIGCWNISNDSIYSGSNSYDNNDTIYIGSLGLSIRNKFTVNSEGLLQATNASIDGKITSLLGNIGNWVIDLNGLHSNNILLDSFNLTIKISLNIVLNGDGSFILQNSLNSYIKQQNNLLLIKTNNISILTLKFLLDSYSLNIKFGLLLPFNSGSGIFIGKDQSTSPTLLNDSLISSGSNLLAFGGTASSAYSYSDYKMFIGDPNSNYLNYDGANLLLNGSISASAGNIGGWNIDVDSLYKDSVSMTVNSTYWNITSSLPSANTIRVNAISDIYNTSSIAPGAKHYIFNTVNYSMMQNVLYVLLLNATAISGSNDSGTPKRTVGIVIYLTSGSVDLLIAIPSNSIDYYSTTFSYVLSYRPTMNNSKFKIMYVLKSLLDVNIATGTWLALDDMNVKLSLYNNLTLLSNKGLFVYNNPNDYLRIGTITSGSNIFPICLIKANKLDTNNIFANKVITSNITSNTNNILLMNALSVDNRRRTHVNGTLFIHDDNLYDNPSTVILKSQLSFDYSSNTGSTYIHHYHNGGWKYPLALLTYSGSTVCRGRFGFSAISSTYNWYFNGSIGATDDIVSNVSSDIRLKLNIKVILNPLDKIDLVSGYSYNFKLSAKLHLRNKKLTGIIAQLIQKILPDAVILRLDGYLAVDYKQITPLLILCIKLLKKLIKEIKKWVLI